MSLSTVLKCCCCCSCCCSCCSRFCCCCCCCWRRSTIRLRERSTRPRVLHLALRQNRGNDAAGCVVGCVIVGRAVGVRGRRLRDMGRGWGRRLWRRRYRCAGRRCASGHASPTALLAIRLPVSAPVAADGLRSAAAAGSIVPLHPSASVGSLAFVSRICGTRSGFNLVVGLTLKAGPAHAHRRHRRHF